jgi:hypothetical protein
VLGRELIRKRRGSRRVRRLAEGRGGKAWGLWWGWGCLCGACRYPRICADPHDDVYSPAGACSSGRVQMYIRGRRMAPEPSWCISTFDRNGAGMRTHYSSLIALCRRIFTPEAQTTQRGNHSEDGGAKGKWESGKVAKSLCAWLWWLQASPRAFTPRSSAELRPLREPLCISLCVSQSHPCLSPPERSGVGVT